MSDAATLVVAVAIVAAIAAAAAVVGVRLGILVAPRLTRWAERDADEEPGEHDAQP